MFKFNYKTVTATLIVAGIFPGIPFQFTPAVAQNWGNQRDEVIIHHNFTIPAGTQIPVRSEQGTRILVTKNENMPLTLTVAAPIRNRNGKVLIPRGSHIVGNIQPAGDGSRFVAEKLIFPRGRQDSLVATSQIITRTEKISSGSNTRAILQGTIVGGAAASILAAVTGDGAIATEEVLGGAGLGALGGLVFGKGSQELISIYPDTDLDLTLHQDLIFEPRF